MTVAIVTGGSSGIGFNAAKKLVEKGIITIIASRNPENVAAAVNQIKTETGRDNVEGMKLDLSDMDSVRSFSAEFHRKNIPLNILVNNAGIQTKTKQLTKQGVELTFASNHLGHFLLTNLLLDKLKEGGPSRVVNVSSTLHDYASSGPKGVELTLDTYNFDSIPYDMTGAYRFSKLANVLFTYELSRRLEGTAIISNAMCPGFVPESNFGRELPGWLRWVFKNVMYYLPMARTLDHGGDCIVDLATKDGEAAVGGQYFSDRKAVKSSPRSYDVAEQKRLWDVSAKLAGL